MTGSSSISLTLTDVWRAWVAFRQGKKPSRAIVEFEANLEANLLKLCYDLNNDAYVHMGYNHKIINEKKRRDIYVASVRDRVVHRLLYDYLVEIVDKRLDYDVWSCRTDKGLHSALKRTQGLLQKYPTAWIWRADVRKFFDSVSHDRLLAVINAQVNCERTKDLLAIVIASYTFQSVSQSVSPVGLPIGNLTSQILANMYLNEFDVYVRSQLKPLAYVRYGDDFILFYPTIAAVKEARQLATQQLWLLGLTVHTKQDKIIRAWQGLHFLGHVISASHLEVTHKINRIILDRVNLQNVSSYASLHVSETTRAIIPWLPEV